MKRKIIIKVFVLIILLIVLFNISNWLNKGSATANSNTVANSTFSNTKKDILYKTQTKVEEFMVHISNEEYEEAFNMLDENFKKIILEKYFNPNKAEKKYTIESEDTKARYEYNDIYNYYTVTVYSPELSGSDYYNPSNEGKNYNFSESFYKQREIKIDVLDIEPYNFKLIVQFKD